MNEIENELDKEHSEELMQLRNTIADNTRQILINGKTQTLDQLKEKGATDDQIARLLKKHEYELENLKANQAYERERQEEHFRVRKKSWKHWQCTRPKSNIPCDTRLKE